MSTTSRLAFVLLVSLFLSATQAQNAGNTAQVNFTFDFPGSTPDHYSLTVDSSGHGTYISGKPDTGTQKPADSDADSDSTTTSDTPWRYEFQLSDATRALIFDLAKRADYFKGNLDYGKGKIASTGAKTLIYKDALHTSQATYNYSNKPAVEELTRTFQNIAATLEFGHRLDYSHRYQKLGLDEALKQMEGMAKSGALEELQAVAPILKKIADDSTVMNVSRGRAERLLQEASARPH